jgi:formylglycine-generating enzyme required for sulfatase activity
VGKPHLLPKLFGEDTRLWKYEQFNSPELLAAPEHLARSGANAGCAGAYGIYDLVGNLHEWVAGTVTDELMETLEKDDVEREKQPWHVGNGIFVGGFFSTTNEHGPGCLYTTVAHEPRYHDYSTGFRCCKDAPRADAKRAPPTSGRPSGNEPRRGSSR